LMCDTLAPLDVRQGEKPHVDALSLIEPGEAHCRSSQCACSDGS
jgi:hypothetical protein